MGVETNGPAVNHSCRVDLSVLIPPMLPEHRTLVAFADWGDGAERPHNAALGANVRLVQMRWVKDRTDIPVEIAQAAPLASGTGQECSTPARAPGRTRSGSSRLLRTQPPTARSRPGCAAPYYAHLFFIHAPTSSSNSLIEKMGCSDAYSCSCEPSRANRR